jgi:hypothetical protein
MLVEGINLRRALIACNHQSFAKYSYGHRRVAGIKMLTEFTPAEAKTKGHVVSLDDQTIRPKLKRI